MLGGNKCRSYLKPHIDSSPSVSFGDSGPHPHFFVGQIPLPEEIHWSPGDSKLHDMSAEEVANQLVVFDWELFSCVHEVRTLPPSNHQHSAALPHTLTVQHTAILLHCAHNNIKIFHVSNYFNWQISGDSFSKDKFLVVCALNWLLIVVFYMHGRCFYSK